LSQDRSFARSPMGAFSQNRPCVSVGSCSTIGARVFRAMLKPPPAKPINYDDFW
jgi:hypothetical protein